MARVPDADIERLKAEVPLVSLAEAAGAGLARTGADLAGRCPFHDDDSPSLVISPGKNLWHCLGAFQAGGSVIDWVMRAEGVSFRHAVEMLRDGLPAVPPAGAGPKRSTVRRLEIVGDYGPDDAVPPTAIRGAWKVGDDGEIIGDFLPNPVFEPPAA